MAATGCVIRNVKVAVVNYLPQQHVLELLVRLNQTSAPVIDDKKSTQRRVSYAPFIHHDAKFLGI